MRSLSDIDEGDASLAYAISMDDDEDEKGSERPVVVMSHPIGTFKRENKPALKPENGNNTMTYNADESSTATVIQVGQWSTGIFDCCETCVPNCCMVMCCPCVTEAQIATRLGLSYCTILISFMSSQLLFLFSLTLGLTHSAGAQEMSPWNYVAILVQLVKLLSDGVLRTRLRKRFELPGNILGDCCLTCCCSWCSLAQMATHVKSYKPGSCGFGPPNELPGYED